MSKNNLDVHFSSKKQDWTTPITFFEKYNSKYKFTLDAACETHNKLVEKGLTFDTGIDSLSQNWTEQSNGGWVWCNPPYGRELGKFIKKAYDESKRGCKIVMLIPARPCTKAWHEYIFGTAKVEFIRGRLKFGESKTPAPFPSAIVIYGEENE